MKVGCIFVYTSGRKISGLVCLRCEG